MIGLGGHDLQPAAHFGRIDQRVETALDVRRRHGRRGFGLCDDGTGAKNRCGHNGNGPKDATHDSPQFGMQLADALSYARTVK